MSSRQIPKLKQLRKPSHGYWAVGMLVTGILASLYPVFVYPYFNIQQYKDAQKVNRAGIDPDKIQPGNMRVWSDPFAPLPEPKR